MSVEVINPKTKITKLARCSSCFIQGDIKEIRFTNYDKSSTQCVFLCTKCREELKEKL